MADSNDGVAPETAEENSNIITLADVAEASGVSGDEFIESQSSSEAEEPVEEETTEAEVAEEPAVAEVADEPETVKSIGDSDGVKKRIGKLVEQRTKAEEERDELKRQLEEMQGNRQSYKDEGMDRFAEVNTHEKLERMEEDAEHLRDWLIANPDGGDYTDLHGTEHEIEYESARKLMVDTDKDLRKNIPAVRGQLELRAKNEQLAVKNFPWMQEEGHAQKTKLIELLRGNPHLAEYYRKDPASWLTMGFLLEGIQVANQPVKESPPPTAPAVPSAPTRAKRNVVKQPTDDRDELLKRASSGEVDDATKYIETLL